MGKYLTGNTYLIVCCCNILWRVWMELEKLMTDHLGSYHFIGFCGNPLMCHQYLCIKFLLKWPACHMSIDHPCAKCTPHVNQTPMCTKHHHHTIDVAVHVVFIMSRHYNAFYWYQTPRAGAWTKAFPFMTFVLWSCGARVHKEMQHISTGWFIVSVWTLTACILFICGWIPKSF